MAEKLDFTLEENSNLGVLKVSGYLRGKPLSVNSLVHIPGWGDFQMKQIEGLEYEQSISDKMDKIPVTKLLAVADPDKQASLESENIPDPMDAEQTWPTNEELEEAEKERKNKKLTKKIPKGMSDYQACWIPDEDIEEIDDDDDDNDLDEEMDKMSVIDEAGDEMDEPKVRFSDEKLEILSVTEDEMDAEKYDEAMDMDEEKRAREKIKEAKLDQMFPDEIDTPTDMLAKDRFQKYRGLSSFRTSPWDPKENLPYDYARIFQFENFNRTRKRIFKEIEEDSADGVPVRFKIMSFILFRKMLSNNFFFKNKHKYGLSFFFF